MKIIVFYIILVLEAMRQLSKYSNSPVDDDDDEYYQVVFPLPRLQAVNRFQFKVQIIECFCLNNFHY